MSELPEILTHYYRSFSKPLQSLSALPAGERPSVLEQLSRHEPLPFRLAHPDYLSERLRIERIMRDQFVGKGGRIEREHPHYFVLGVFSLWEADGSRKLEVTLASIPTHFVSFTLTDSFFNYRTTNLRRIPIPKRACHGELFTLGELREQVELHGLPGDAWRSDPARTFDVYIEAQIWSDAPLRHLLESDLHSTR